jgi:hypothetical protein
LALAQIVPTEKKYKPSKLETFANVMGIAQSLGSMIGTIGKFSGGSGGTQVSDYLTTPKMDVGANQSLNPANYNVGNATEMLGQPTVSLDAYQMTPLKRYMLGRK